MTSPDTGDTADRSGSAVGDRQAFERMFQEYLDPLTRFVYSYVKVWDVAEDLVHDVFLQLWLRHCNLEPVRDLAAYLYTIARYDALDYLRHQRIEERHHRVAPRDPTLPAEAEHTVLANEVAAVLHRAVDALPPRQREVILLRWERQATYEQIAAKLGISVKTVDAHLQRAFATLRKLLPKL